MPTRCPVCGRAGLQATAAECPQCNADLEAFQLLDTLQEPPVLPTQTAVADETRTLGGPPPLVRPSSLGSVFPALLAVFAGFLLAMGFVYLVPRPDAVVPVAPLATIEPVLRQIQQQLEETRTRITQRDEATAQRLDERLARIAEQLPAFTRREDQGTVDERLARLEQHLRQWREQAPTQPAQPTKEHSAIRVKPRKKGPERPVPDTSVPDAPASPGFTPMTNEAMRVHDLAGSDTLWNVAERYYGTGRLYPVLLVLNPGLGTRFFPHSKIRLPVDQAAARRLLAESIVAQNGRQLLRYPVVAGDTWPAISQRLYGHTQLAAELDRLNGGKPPAPGAPVLVPLISRQQK